MQWGGTHACGYTVQGHVQTQKARCWESSLQTVDGWLIRYLPTFETIWYCNMFSVRDLRDVART